MLVKFKRLDINVQNICLFKNSHKFDYFFIYVKIKQKKGEFLCQVKEDMQKKN